MIPSCNQHIMFSYSAVIVVNCKLSVYLSQLLEPLQGRPASGPRPTNGRGGRGSDRTSTTGCHPFCRATCCSMVYQGWFGGHVGETQATWCFLDCGGRPRNLAKLQGQASPREEERRPGGFGGHAGLHHDEGCRPIKFPASAARGWACQEDQA